MCEHLNTETVDEQVIYTTEGGPAFEITSHEYCTDCGAEVEPPVMEWLEYEPEPELIF